MKRRGFESKDMGELQEQSIKPRDLALHQYQVNGKEIKEKEEEDRDSGDEESNSPIVTCNAMKSFSKIDSQPLHEFEEREASEYEEEEYEEEEHEEEEFEEHIRYGEEDFQDTVNVMVRRNQERLDKEALGEEELEPHEPRDKDYSSDSRTKSDAASKPNDRSMRNNEIRETAGFSDLVASIPINMRFEKDWVKYPLRSFFMDIDEEKEDIKKDFHDNLK